MSTQKLVRTSMFLAVALVFQIGFRQFAQPLVGPLVNMTLILATLVVGPISAIIIGIITPLVAFVLGIVGVPFLVPLIGIGNALFVGCFYLAKKNIKVTWSSWPSIVLASVVKFGFLYVAARALLPLVLPKVPAPLLATFSLPQLYTALLGGALAIIIYRFLPATDEWL